MDRNERTKLVQSLGIAIDAPVASLETVVSIEVLVDAFRG
ncbi:hypothetical protein Q31a_51430 [Aureliella helgolandensis]|uniref:Uncharacterized protein n=1 Tax=Aureliella helgolandensis TaxID=2527968 RepID=A0A518GDT6_9BACT|nr:hypothetical protein Q31a_51430 [Aureliella helgolandensis]